MKDLNGAFPDTPEYVRSAIHRGLRRARRRQALRRRLFMAASVAAVLAVMFGALSLAVSGRRFLGGLPRTPSPGPLAHGQLTAGPTPMPMPRTTQQPTPTPMPTPRAEQKPERAAVETHMPTPMPKTAVTVFLTAMPVPEAPIPTVYYSERAAISEAALVAEVSEAAGSESAAEQMVYSTKRGKFYHSDWSCSGMLGASARRVSEAEKLGQTACPICMPEDPTVWTTRSGGYYHDSKDCSGMRYSVSMSESEALAAGRRLCPLCQASRSKALSVGLYSTDGGKYYHADPQCSDMLGAVKRSEEEIERLGQKPCPICIK